MKKITGLLCSIAMLFSLTACGGSKVNDDAIDAFEEAIINVVKIESTDYSVGMDVTADGTTAKMDASGTFINKDAKPQLSMSVDVESDGQVQKDMLQFFFTNDVFYMNMMDLMKQKQAMPLSALAQASSDTVKKGTLKDSGIKDYLKEATLKDGKITLDFDTAKLKEEIKKAAKSDTSGTLTAYKDIQISELKIEMNVKNKMMEKTNLILKISNPSNKDQKMDMKFNISFKNIDKAKDIVFPDFTDYVEANSSDSLLGM